MTGPEYLPVSEGSERAPERGSAGPMGALLAELNRARELLEGIEKQAREDNARLARFERVLEAARLAREFLLSLRACLSKNSPYYRASENVATALTDALAALDQGGGA